MQQFTAHNIFHWKKQNNREVHIIWKDLNKKCQRGIEATKTTEAYIIDDKIILKW